MTDFWGESVSKSFEEKSYEKSSFSEKALNISGKRHEIMTWGPSSLGEYLSYFDPILPVLLRI